MKPLVFVTEEEYRKAEDVLMSSDDFECRVSAPDENILAKAVAEHKAVGVIIGLDIYRDQLYKVLPPGSVIARFGVGHDGVDKQKASENGLIATNTPGALDNSVAELAISLIACFSRNLSRHDKDMKSRTWQPIVGNELKGKTVLILGCGAIGKKVAKIAGAGFGMNVLGYDLAQLDEEQLKKEFGFEEFVASLDEAIGRADFISLHIPAIAATKHFVNEKFLSKTKSNCVIINTARGLVLDDAALYDALQSGKLAGAAIDVFENEPYEPLCPGKDLRELENVILTPHIGSTTVEACRQMAMKCLKNIKAAYEKRYDELDILNPDVIAKLK